MKLHIYRRDTLERTLDLTGGDLRIGRGTENDLVLDDADKTVSRFHAELRQEQDEITLIDLHSENGTWIDGQRIHHATLSPGTTIAMGHFRLVLEEPGMDVRRGHGHGHVGADELASLPVMVGHAHRGSSGTPASSVSSRVDAHPSGHADAAMMAMAAAAGAAASAASHTQAGAGPSASTARTAAASVAPAPRAGASSLPKPVLYAACLVVAVLLVGVPYVLWPRGDRATHGVGAGTAEAAGADAHQQNDAAHGGRGAANAAGPNGAGPNAAGANGAGANAGAAGAHGASSGAAGAGGGRDGSGSGGGSNGADNASASVGTGTNDTRSSSSADPQDGTTPSARAAAAGVQAAGMQAGTAANGGVDGNGMRAAASGTQPSGVSSGQPTLTSVATGSSSSPNAGGVPSGGANGGAPAPPSRPLTRAEKAAMAKREQAAANLYARGKAALAAGNYADATTAFESVMREKSNHLDTPVLLEQARQGVRNDAVRVASQAAALAAKGDFRGAIREYERARQIDPALDAVASGIADVRTKMKAAGDEAYRRARQLEAVGRMQDATAQYTRAADLLSADDANGKAARERLDLLTRQP